MALSTCCNSVCATAISLFFLMPAVIGKMSAAKMAITAMTTSSSISVKAARRSNGVEVGVFMVWFLAFAQFFFHPFTEPLFDHALVIQITRPGQPFDPRQHTRVNAQCDIDRLRRITIPGDGTFHEPEIRLVRRPET